MPLPGLDSENIQGARMAFDGPPGKTDRSQAETRQQKTTATATPGDTPDETPERQERGASNAFTWNVASEILKKWG